MNDFIIRISIILTILIRILKGTGTMMRRNKKNLRVVYENLDIDNHIILTLSRKDYGCSKMY
jgi:hypothetical protein